MKTASRLQQVIRYHRYGGSEVLQLESTPIPKIRENELLIEIKATGVNPIDWKLREGMGQVTFPFIPGVEASGIILKAGNDVKDHYIGQPVYGPISQSYAQFALVDFEYAFNKPEHLSFEEAAAVGGGKTAWGALFELAHLKRGERVLIHGASGGVGVFAVQLARLAGAHVIATASAQNKAALEALGAHEIVDSRLNNFAEHFEKVDVVLDGVGGELLQRSYPIVKKGGILLSIVDYPSQVEAAHLGIRAGWGGTKRLAAMLAVDRHLHSGEIKPVVSKIFSSLQQAALAQDYSQIGPKRMGKIVLKVS